MITQNGRTGTDALRSTSRAYADSADYSEFKACVLQRSGIDLGLYKPQQMHRRLLTLVERTHSADFMDYFRLLERDDREYGVFLDRMTINVSEFMRDPERWSDLRETILPGLLESSPAIRVWSAGCSDGAEPYSLAIELAELAPGGEHTIVATDIDRTALSRAATGRFSAHDVRNLDVRLLTAYFDKQSGDREMGQIRRANLYYRVKPKISGRIGFASHNLLADEFATGFDLICCRNVIIYFTEAAKERLFDRFYRALAPGGVLFLGAMERIIHHRAIGFECLSPGFYRRIRRATIGAIDS